MEEAKVSFYRVSACGYYRRRDQVPRFGHIDSVLADLKSWGSNKRLAYTKTFSNGPQMPVYLVDVTKSGAGDAWLLTLWNEAHNTDGAVASIDGRANVGSADVSETEVEEGHIPGHATYFWFLPNEGLVASVRFQHPTTGTTSMNKYLSSFIKSFTSHTVLGEADDHGKLPIVGYRANLQAQPENLLPRFKTDVFVKPGPADYIAEHAQLIRKIKRKSTLDLAIHTDKSMFQKLLEGLSLSTHQSTQQEVNIQYEVDVDGLSTEEVGDIVNEWSEDAENETDFGFMLRGSSEVHWLGKAYVREKLQLDVDRENAEVVQPRSLLKELARHKTSLLELLN
jgi:hypothetical protein